MESKLDKVESKVIVVDLEEWEACKNMVILIDFWFSQVQENDAVKVLEEVIFKE